MKVLITGAGSGLGLALTNQLIADGHFVVALDNVTTSLQQLEDNYGPKLRALLADVTDVKSLEAAKARLTSEQLPDVIINNAGVGHYETVEMMSEETWRRLLEVNLTGPFLVTKTFLPDIKAAQGKIMNIGSIRATKTDPRYAGYCASKFGLRGFTLSLAAELGPAVKVMIAEIGPMMTDFGNRLQQRQEQQQKGEKILLPEEVAKELVAYLTGQKPWAAEINL